MRLTRFVAAALLIALPASANAQFDVNSTTSADKITITSFGPYSPAGTYNAALLLTPGNPVIDVWCVDFLNSVEKSPVMYPANFTRFDAAAGDFDARTRFGTGYWTEYAKAAYLAKWHLASAGSKPVALDIHCAIWHLFTPFAVSASPLCSARGAAIAYYQGLAAGAWASHVNPRYWFVVSDPALEATYGSTGTNRALVGYQEFVTYQTPEPAVSLLLATGLVGMMAAGFRRRKNG